MWHLHHHYFYYFSSQLMHYYIFLCDEKKRRLSQWRTKSKDRARNISRKWEDPVKAKMIKGSLALCLYMLSKLPRIFFLWSLAHVLKETMNFFLLYVWQVEASVTWHLICDLFLVCLMINSTGNWRENKRTNFPVNISLSVNYLCLVFKKCHMCISMY